ncbi:MAG TPA: hypothetical protein PKM21_14990 [Anaerolineales bacterium]|nr:hypothetical protein [Anaerolineales bacterium]
MSDLSEKPLNWKPDPTIGYTVVRRADGGMNFTFTDASMRTLEHWRDFSEEHLLDSDRLTCNLYDLRQIKELPYEAIQIALQLSADPSTRNIRMAVVIANEDVRKGIQQIVDLTAPLGLEMGIFTDIAEAEAWLNRPLTMKT